jgi:hypothetical protein
MFPGGFRLTTYPSGTADCGFFWIPSCPICHIMGSRQHGVPVRGPE